MEKPNIIVINIDDLGYGDIGCYGSERNKTPNIDKLAEDGVLFTDFYASSPVCSPSRAGFLTGCYPKRIDFQSFKVYDPARPEQPKDEFVVLMPGQPEGLNPSEKTVANVLKDAGYATEIIGKWHVGDQDAYSPLNFGFDKYFGIPYSNDMGLQTPEGIFKRMEYTICPLPLMRDREVVQEQPDMTSLTERYTCEAVQFIKDNRNKPFFLYFAHTYIHHPLYASARFLDGTGGDVFAASLAAVDWSVAAIVDTLEELGISDNTWIVFMSDNGGDLRSSNKPLRGNKGSTWEGGERVCCVMKWPRVIRKGRVSHEIVTNMDFFATFAEIAGRKDDGVIRDGKSMLDILRDENAKSEHEAFCYYASNDLEAVRVGDFKLRLKTGELYNLAEDIGETTDVADKFPEQVAKITEVADYYRKELGDDYTGTKGRNCRKKGFVKEFGFRTQYDPRHPYMIALYDLDDAKEKK